MKIEITDRDYWREQCQKALDNIQAQRDAEDAEYEAEWLKGKRFFFFNRTGKPPVKGTMFHQEYPSIYGSWLRCDIHDLLGALRTEGTGQIFIESDTLRSIEARAMPRSVD